MRTRSTWGVFLLVCILAGSYLRFVGLTRGISDFVVPARAISADQAFYHFHPDEALLIEGALALDSPLDPPLTSYGMLPLYMLRGLAEACDRLLGWEVTNVVSTESTYRVVLLARILAATFSCLSMGLVYLLARRCFGIPAACLATLLMSTAPLAVQQAHYYTVDGLFLLLVLFFFHFLFHALESGRVPWYALVGAAVGMIGAVRLNGLVLGLIVLAGHCLWTDPSNCHSRWVRAVRRLLSPHVWVSGAAALAVLVILAPYLVADSERVFVPRPAHNFALALQIAKGDMLTLWNLVDVHTTPYWHHWTSLLPTSVGWPLALASAAGLIFVLRRPERSSALMLMWCGAHFLLVGGLQTKHVRYLLPLLPFFCMFAAAAGIHGWLQLRSRGGRLVARLFTVCTVAYTALFGIAFASIYSVEDSRIQAGRWIAGHLPKSSRLGLEKGAFAFRRDLVRLDDFNTKLMGIEVPFHSRGYMTCRGTTYYLQDHIRDRDYIVITDTNRYPQFTAVPEMFPVVSGFYQRLMDGRLDFELVRRFKQYPELFGWQFKDDGTEPSFLGFDHPSVLVLKRRRGEDLSEIFSRWRDELHESPSCADSKLHQAASQIQAENFGQALLSLQEIQQRYPHMKLSHFMAAEIHRRNGEREQAQAAERRYKEDLQLHRAHLVPWASSLSFLELGLIDYAANALRIGATEVAQYNAAARKFMATYYASIAYNFMLLESKEQAVEAYRLSLQIHETAQAFNGLKKLLP